MTSGSRAKQRRRAEAPPVRRPRQARRASSKVLLIAGAVVLVLAAAGIGIGLALSGGSSKADVPARGSLANALPGAAEVATMLKGIPQHGTVLGSPKAPVTMVEYVDLQCPY